jgi:hypothetical protein
MEGGESYFTRARSSHALFHFSFINTVVTSHIESVAVKLYNPHAFRFLLAKYFDSEYDEVHAIFTSLKYISSEYDQVRAI